MPMFYLSAQISEIANWSSLLGLCISIATLIVANNVSSAIQETNKKTLIKLKLSEDLKSLMDLNSSFYELVNSDNNIEICNLLSRISSQTRIIKRYAPKEFIKQGKSIEKMISKQNRKFGNKDSLWQIYRAVVTLVDELSNYSREKDFVS